MPAPGDGNEYVLTATHVYNYISSAKYSGEENPLSTDHDAAYQANDTWRIPTKAQFDALISDTNTTIEWVTGWTDIGTTKGGRFITSKVNGISLFFAAAGNYYDGSLNLAGDYGYYCSSTPNGSDKAYGLLFASGLIEAYPITRLVGFSVRPVKN